MSIEASRKNYSNSRCPVCGLKVMNWDIKENMNLSWPFPSIAPSPCFECVRRGK